MLLTNKLLFRLFLFVFVYSSYLFIFNYVSITQLDNNEINFNNNLNNEKQRQSAKIDDDNTICPNSEQADAILQEYIPIQNKHLDTLNSTGKFIVFSAIDVAGLGNRIPTLVSCFILSLLMERGFLVHWPAVDDNSIAFKDEIIGMVSFENLFNTPFFMDATLHPLFYDRISPENSIMVSMESISDILLCGNLDEIFGDMQFIIIYGWRPFFDILLKNKIYLDKVQKMNLNYLIPEISQCILPPIPLVSEIIQKFKKENNISPHTKIVGVHIRKLSKHGLTEDQEIDLWDCVRAKYPPPPLSFSFQENYSNFNSSILYFLASDSLESRIRAPPDFQPYIVMVRSSDTTRTSVLGLAHALADTWLLGQTEEVFGAQGTTFVTMVRTLFGVPTQLASWGPNHTHADNAEDANANAEDARAETRMRAHHGARCVPFRTMPCFKWWDVYREHNLSLSCFMQISDNSRDSHWC